MSRAERARRIAERAAFGGGGAVGIGAGLAGILLAEARLARRRVGQPRSQPFSVDGTYGPSSGTPSGPPLVMAVLGDSGAAGLGADVPGSTPAVSIAERLADISGRPVTVHLLATIGAKTSDVLDQVDEAVQLHPDIALVMVGANDVTHAVRPAASVRHLEQIVRRLVEVGCPVVVGTCPDLGTVEPVMQPLRAVGRRWSRTLAAAQAITVVEAGGRAVSLGGILGPEFGAQPREYFSADGFHPSSLGYTRAADVLLPSVCAALGLGQDPEPELDTTRGERLVPVSQAAAEAAGQAGTEVTAGSVAGLDRGERGRWAELRHRIPLLTDRAHDPSPEGSHDTTEEPSPRP